MRYVRVTIFPFSTMKVSVPSSKRLSAVSAFHTMVSGVAVDLLPEHLE